MLSMPRPAAVGPYSHAVREGGLLFPNIYLTDLADFSTVNAIYATIFTEPHPARTTVAVAGLPLGAAVEIELVARAR
jgi:2-iminobutanoate/2-iminopropanoate deaminase